MQCHTVDPKSEETQISKDVSMKDFENSSQYSIKNERGREVVSVHVLIECEKFEQKYYFFI